MSARIIVSAFAVGLMVSLSLMSAEPNKLTPEEEQAGWKLLFDGKTTKGWRGLGRKEFPEGWDVVDGCIHHKPEGGGGDITFDGTYEDFEFSVEWKVAPKANSGIKYRVPETPGKQSAFGPEYQLLDDGGAKPKNATAAIYDVFPANDKKKLKPVGEFNTTRIVAKGNHVEHWLNGEKVLEYEFGSDAWKSAVANSKFKKSTTFASPKKGQICFQDHGGEVWYRNIKIRDLKRK